MVRGIKKEQASWMQDIKALQNDHKQDLNDIESRCAYEIAEKSTDLRDIRAHVQTQARVTTKANFQLCCFFFNLFLFLLQNLIIF
jgi:hypothetical protein